MFELLIWPQEITLARWTQPSGPLCLWQCSSLYASRTLQSCHRFCREILLLLLVLPELHNLLHPCIRDAKIWRENEKMRRKWRENEEMEREYGNGERMRKFREIHSLLFLISTLFPPSLSIHFLHQKLTHFVAKLWLLSKTQEGGGAAPNGGVSLGNTNLYYRKYGGDEVQDVCEGREIRKGHNIGAQIIDDLFG